MGSRTIKTVKNKDYLYYLVYEDGKQRAIYCGPVVDPKTEKKALQLELKQLKEQKKEITQQILEIESELKK